VGLKRETTQCHAVNVSVIITIHIYENIHPQTQHDAAHRSLHLDTAQGPKGLGELSLSILEAEVCDWNRFSNRKQVGSYTGCCPGEHSSGGKRRLGCIDRMGNGRVRSILVETVWRLLVWQPLWISARKMKLKLLDGPAMRKKAVVALARQLAIDLWRWRTG